MEVPTKDELNRAAAAHGLNPLPEIWIEKIQGAYTKIDRQGGIQSVADQIAAKIEASRVRLAAGLGDPEAQKIYDVARGIVR
jgi:hypothetical protein